MTTTIDTDRIALSSELLSLAEAFAIEASMWAEGCREELRRNSQQLATLGRAVLATSDLQQADAFARAARRILGNVQGTRRFFGVILTPPNVKRKDTRHGQ